MNVNKPTVFIVDDDAAYLGAVARLLRASGLLVKTFTSATEFLRQRSPNAPGCVVTDLQMPGMNGIELQSALAKTENPLPLVFLTGRGDIPTSVAAVRCGAEDFLTKLASRETLLAAVNRALERDARERAGRDCRREVHDRFKQLTPRDQEVLAHVLRGQLNKQIAAELCIDERSVKRHRTSLMQKLRVQSMAELFHLAHEAGMAGPHWMITAIVPRVPHGAIRPRP